MNTDVHCSWCGSLTYRETDDEGYTVLICSNDDCPRIVVAVIAAPVVRDPDAWAAVAKACK